MFGWGVGCTGFWWVYPLLFFLVMGFFMMRGCGCMSGWGGRGQRRDPNSAIAAEEILKRRYALGEIDLERFEEMKKKIAE
ncbi:SHOCT domain-containing protein [Geomonas sp. RF6]|uniref:SHOCT domain-containing protein n=1 Tax=Geomonas sp. RF6 TaxID=2897342 RepID=UPI001E5B0388|nr:SHOCT domain-containing protein [Geomonas sp. RF6]UFS70621.1 SHOCT domain-containing protein [Geomonas sp. RF6]